MPAKCAACGKNFMARRPDVNRGMGFLCSFRCLGAWRSKYRGKPVGVRSRGGKREDLNNQYFRSCWEANWARYLNFLVKTGNPTENPVVKWEYEADTFEFVGIRRGSRFYTPDFKVWKRDGSVEYQEVKGWMDQQSVTKLKRMKKYHEGICIIVVDKPVYRNVSMSMKSIIPHWEIAGPDKHSW